MVLTRRAAKAAAEAEAAKKAAVEEAKKVPNDELTPRSFQQDATNGKIKNKTSRVNLYLQLGHVLACVAVATAAHAASLPDGDPLVYHAIALLLCIIPLRTLIAVKSRSPTLKQKGISLAISTPSVFASNALHLLASRADPTSLLRYVTASATQVAAAWLDMSVAFTKPTSTKFIMSISLLDSAADVFLAAVVAQIPSIKYWSRPFFFARVGIDIFRITKSFARIVSKDENERSQTTDVIKEPPS